MMSRNMTFSRVPLFATISSFSLFSLFETILLKLSAIRHYEKKVSMLIIVLPKSCNFRLPYTPERYRALHSKRRSMTDDSFSILQ